MIAPCAIGWRYIFRISDNMRLWSIDENTSKLQVQDVGMGKLRREYTNMRVSPSDDVMYAGTMSGDIVKVQLNRHKDTKAVTDDAPPVLLGCFGRHNPKKAPGKDCEKYANGVRDLLILNATKQLLIGAGDGTIELVEERNVKFSKEHPASPTWPQLKSVRVCRNFSRTKYRLNIFCISFHWQLKRRRVNGSVTSLREKLNFIFIGTDACEIYVLDLILFDLKLVITCNTSAVYDVAFPK